MTGKGKERCGLHVGICTAEKKIQLRGYLFPFFRAPTYPIPPVLTPPFLLCSLLESIYALTAFACAKLPSVSTLVSCTPLRSIDMDGPSTTGSAVAVTAGAGAPPALLAAAGVSTGSTSEDAATGVPAAGTGVGVAATAEEATSGRASEELAAAGDVAVGVDSTGRAREDDEAAELELLLLEDDEGVASALDDEEDEDEDEVSAVDEASAEDEDADVASGAAVGVSGEGVGVSAIEVASADEEDGSSAGGRGSEEEAAGGAAGEGSTAGAAGVVATSVGVDSAGDATGEDVATIGLGSRAGKVAGSADAEGVTAGGANSVAGADEATCAADDAMEEAWSAGTGVPIDCPQAIICIMVTVETCVIVVACIMVETEVSTWVIVAAGAVSVRTWVTVEASAVSVTVGAAPVWKTVVVTKDSWAPLSTVLAYNPFPITQEYARFSLNGPNGTNRAGSSGLSNCYCLRDRCCAVESCYRSRTNRNRLLHGLRDSDAAILSFAALLLTLVLSIALATITTTKAAEQLVQKPSPYRLVMVAICAGLRLGEYEKA